MSMDRVEQITVDQLRALLDDYDGDLPVGFGYPYGDHWNRTGVGVPMIAEEKSVKWSPNLRSIVVDETESPANEVWLILED
jgi:hypothetical protein